MAEIEVAIAKELAAIVNERIDARTAALGDRLAELERRLNALEATNAMRAGLDALTARLAALEQKSIRLVRGAA